MREAGAGITELDPKDPPTLGGRPPTHPAGVAEAAGTNQAEFGERLVFQTRACKGCEGCDKGLPRLLSASAAFGAVPTVTAEGA